MTGDTLGERAARPTFVWGTVPDATTYELEVDDECPAEGFATCTFPSPEISVKDLTEAQYSPATDLPISQVQPVGRRYYWRFRPCRADACSDWSDVRYFDAARQQRDFNGDGFADVLLTKSPGTADTSCGVFFGAAQLDGQVDTVLLTAPSARLVSMPAPIGDVNADGFADWLVVSSAPGPMAMGSTGYVLQGASSPTTAPPSTFQFGSKYGGGGFSPIGDFDVDGRADLLYASTGMASRMVIHRGPDLSAQWSIAASPPTPPIVPNFYGAGVHDVNFDGIPDFIMGQVTPGTTPETTPSFDFDLLDGAFVAREFASTPQPSRKLQTDGMYFPSTVDPVGPGDVDGDHKPDILIGRNCAVDFYSSRHNELVARALVPDLTPCDAPIRAEQCDVNGDGIMDVLASTNAQTWIYQGAPDLNATPLVAFPERVTCAGDVNGDRRADVIGSDGNNPWERPGKARLYLGGPSMDAVADIELSL